MDEEAFRICQICLIRALSEFLSNITVCDDVACPATHVVWRETTFRACVDTVCDYCRNHLDLSNLPDFGSKSAAQKAFKKFAPNLAARTGKEADSETVRAEADSTRSKAN